MLWTRMLSVFHCLNLRTRASIRASIWDEPNEYGARFCVQSHSPVSDVNVSDGFGRPAYFSTMNLLDIQASNKASRREEAVFQNLMGKKNNTQLHLLELIR